MAIKNGSTVTLDYKVYVDGQLVDQTSPGEPLVYTQGAGQIIPGLEKGLEGLNKGDKKEVVVQPSEAYGEYSEERVLHIPREDLPEDIEPQVGMQLQATSQSGDMYVGVISEVLPDHIDVDFNHPMAGKTLVFEVEVQDVKE
ncbi:MAG: peptidylprolyl isomerase [Actinomycetota bacterium]|nr:peptidylprolyl isomerase [Actinomycetota bacterium]